MNILDLPMQAFKTLVLKPLDFVLFGGSGLLSRSRDEWRQVIQDSLPPPGTSLSRPRPLSEWGRFTPGANLTGKATGQPVDDYYVADFPPFPSD